MNLEFRNKDEAIEFKSTIMVGMLNGSYDWSKGAIMRDAIDIWIEEGGSFEAILNKRFGVSFEQPFQQLPTENISCPTEYGNVDQAAQGYGAATTSSPPEQGQLGSKGIRSGKTGKRPL